MRTSFTLLLLLVSGVLGVRGQCPVLSLQSPGTGCAASTLTFSASSQQAGIYDWDFCAGDFIQPAFDTSHSDVNQLLNIVAGVRAISDSSGDHVFVCSRDNGKLIRVDYDNGYGTSATSFTDLGNLGGNISRPNSIQFIGEGGIWYSLTVDVFSNTVTRSEFLNGLDSLPTSSSIVINTGLNLPEGVDIVRTAEDSVFALVANFQDNRILIYSFGTSILNAPVLADSFTVTGADGITDIDVIRDCDRWYAAVTVYRTPDLILTDLGTTLSDVQPLFTSFNNGQVYPYGIRIVNDGGIFYCFNSTAVGTLNIHELGPRLSAPTITFKGSYPVNAGTISGIDLIRKGSTWFGFAPVESWNILKELTFRDTCSALPGSDSTSFSSQVRYFESGNYRIGLCFTDTSGNTSFTSTTVTIHPLPQLAASISGSCLGDTTSFSDLSFISSGFLSGTVWLLGDGDSAFTASASHVYTDSGQYVVSLISVSDQGCISRLDTPLYIAPLPFASFSASGGCSQSPLTITEQSSDPVGTIASWAWDFGNGDTLSGNQPYYAYSTPGNFTISLTVTSAAGCTDTDTTTVTIAERPEGNVSVSNTCVNQPVQFIDLSTSNTSAITGRYWQFGDGDTSVALSPTHIYPTGSGDFPLQLIVSSANGCTDTVARIIRISPPPAVSFMVSSASVCERSDVVFTDLSTVTGDTVTAWQWDFGDGTSSEEKNPTHRYDTAGTYSVSLIAYSPTSCPGPVYQMTVNVLESPRSGFTSSLTCLGGATTFTDTSLLPSGASLGSIQWDFGNGDSSSLQHPIVQYSTAGNYLVVQTVTTTDGCSNTATGYVRVYAPPVASMTNIRPCNGQPVQFQNTSSTDGWSAVQSVFWNFGDPASGLQDTSTVFNPSHLFSGASGYTVSLIAITDKGCSDTVQRTILPLPASPAVFTYAPTCYGELMEFFNPGSPLDSIYVWQFGDNQLNYLQEPAHFYALPGTYTVTLSVVAVSGCITTATRQVTVSPVPNAAFAVGTSCIGSSTLLTDQSLVSSGSLVGWNWSVDGMGNVGSSAAVNVLFPDTGSYRVRLTVVSDIGCSDTVSSVVTNHPGPAASFSFDPQYGNPPLTVFFENLSNGASDYSWDFGDGSTDQVSEPVHVFQDSGLFTIRLIATSVFGCSDTIEKSIYVIRPVLDIAVTGDSSYRAGDYFHIVTRLSNLGTREIDRVTLEAQLEDGSVIRERLYRILPTGPAGSTTYSFVSSFLVGGNGTPTYYCVRAIAPNDQEDAVPSNNERCYNRSGETVVLLYPNPVISQLTLDVLMNDKEPVSVQLYDQLGRYLRTVVNEPFTEGLNRRMIDVSGLAAGNYTLKIILRDRFLVHHFVVEK